MGQTGAAAIKQARDFDFSVEVISKTAGGAEKILGEEKIKEARPTAGPSEVVAKTGAGQEKSPEKPGTTEPGKLPSITERWLPVIIAAAIVILAAVLIPLLVRRRHE